MKRKIFSSVLCILLSFLMIVYAVPSSAVAYAIEELTELLEAEEDTLTEESSEQNEEKELDALFELEEMRTADTKYVRMSDGTYKALVYSGAVHELDENGKYVEIDNSLSATLSDYESGNARVKFAKQVTGNERIFKLKKDSYQIALALEYAEKGTNISVLNDGKEEIKAATKLEEISTLSKITSSVSYKDILEGVDLEYVLAGENLKENIIVKEAAESYVYTFALSLNGLSARLNESGDVLLENAEGAVIYTMPAPFMTDANGVYSEDVSYALEAASGNGKYTLTVTASSAWMNAEDRAFPVTIDPTVEVSGSEKVADTYTDDAYPTSSYGPSTILYAGKKNGYSQAALIMLGELADLPVGSIVTNVSLLVDILSNTSSTTQFLYARKITGSYTSLSGINAETELNISSDVYDYAKISAGAIDIYTLDLTRMYHEWVSEGQCRIVRLSLESATSGEYLTIASSNYTSTTQLKPTFEITYINTIGTESYFSYSTQSAGAAGSAAISDHSGQLTISFTDAVSDNSALSVSVGHVYNSVLAQKDYDADGTTLFSNMKTGYGFMLTTQQTVQRKTVEGDEYAVYTDSDGTIHYMPGSYASGSYAQFSDTDGLGLTVIDPDSSTFSSQYETFDDMGFSYASSLILKDQEGTCLLFYNGLPAVFMDKSGNIVKYLYDTTSSSGTTWFPESTGSQLRAIVQNNALEDGSRTPDIQVATLTYSDGYLSSIASPGRTVYYAYETYGTGKLLTAVAVSEYLNSSTNYTTYTLAEYGYTNGILTALRDTERQYGLLYTYDTVKQKYTEYYEFAGTIASHTVGGVYEITYEPRQTTYKYVGADDSGSSGSLADDVYTVNVFDYYGRTVCSYMKDSSGKVYSATAGSYVDSDDFSDNSLADKSSIGAMATNLLVNPSFIAQGSSTMSASWIRSLSSRVMADDTFSRTGEHSLKMVSSATSASAAYAHQLVTGLSGSYCFSVYVNLKDVTAVTGGVKLRVVKVASDGTQTTLAESALYSGNIGNDSWYRLYLPFTAASSASYRLYMYSTGVSGSVYFDDAQLEKASMPGEYNLISATLGGEGTGGWMLSPSTAAASGTSPAADQYTVTGSLSAHVALSQKVYTHATGKGYTLSGWAKFNAIPRKTERDFALLATISYTDSSIPTEYVYIPFNTDIIGWQYISGTVMPTRYAEVESITVSLTFEGNPNDGGRIAGVSLVESDAAGYSYDEKGNLISTSKTDLQTSSYTYSSTNQLTAMANGSVDASISYNNPLNDRLPTTVTTGGITTEYTYDTAGNVIGTVMRPEGSTNDSLKISASSAFNDNLTKQTSSTDERGTVTSYTYNTDGSLKTTTLDGVETEYFYTTKGRQNRVVVDNLANVYYNYSKGNLSSIGVGGMSSTSTILSYYFTYDAFGRTTSVRVMNDHTLATYTYQDKTGWLLSVTYGNGFVISYTYDIFGRTTRVKYNGTEQYSYVYNSAGNLFTFTDHANNVVYRYEYSSTGNLVAEEQFNSDTNAFLQGQYYTYNSYGDVASSTLKVAGQAPIKYVCSYGYEDEDYNRSKTNVTDWQASGSGYNISYFYDALNRTSSQYIMQSGSSSNPLTRTYSYLEGANGGTTALVSSITYSGKSTAAYSYTYDARGNITAVYKGGTLQASYVYDDLNQLIRENNVTANKTWVYTYDERGNILSKKTYAYTTGTLGTVQDTDTYEYFEQSSSYLWGDGLVRYNGGFNVYDAIGNPTQYENGNTFYFTWQNGRQLASGTKGTTEFAYIYNADGLRTKKVVDGVTTEYYWAGSQLAMMVAAPGTSSEKVLKFYYDATGSPFCFDLDGEIYFYITNLQGDIVAIANQYGEGARYEYDAWGKILSISCATGSFEVAAYANPLRYRGYIYDNETEFYYLQSRYYDPAVGRFINSDGQLNGGFLGNNMFAYCENNPVNMADSSGTLPKWALIAIGAAAAVSAIVITVATFGAAAPAAACTLTMAAMSLGASYAVASTAATVAVVATTAVAAAYAGDIAYSSVTGDSILLNTVFQGNEDAYEVGLAVTSIATAGMFQAANMSPGVCFIKGTPVKAENGDIPIEQITAGVLVYANDPETGETALKEVVRTFVNEASELVHITVNGEEIICTNEHPFYSPVKGWIAACKLRAGDILVMLNGERVVVEQVQHELLESPVTVYNFEVEEFHTYYVGDSGVLVHNDCDLKPTSPGQMQKQVERNQAPRGVKMVHPAHQLPHGKPHVHFSDGTSLNNDGTIHDKKNGIPKMTEAIVIWLEENNWRRYEE